MPFDRLPDVKQCCYCIPDLKSATAIIAVLAIVTSPAVAWSVIRHAYVIRVSCFLTTKSHLDVIDINLNNVLSFGFGANAGVGPSCLKSLQPNASDSDSKLNAPEEMPPSGNIQFATGIPGISGNTEMYSKLILSIKIIGWIVLTADLAFVLFACLLLLHLYLDENSKVRKLIKIFLYGAAISIILSFVYGIMYVVTCFWTGGQFPIFEFVFTIVDVGVWTYFVMVVNSYRRSIMPLAVVDRQTSSESK